MGYDPRPCYPLVQGSTAVGYEALAAEIADREPSVVAVDGPATLAWDTFAERLAAALRERDIEVAFVDARRFLLEPAEIERRTLSGPLADDPVFASVYTGSLSDLFAAMPTAGRSSHPTTIFIGPGSARVPNDLLWYTDHPKRVAADAVKRGTAAPLGMLPGARDAARRLIFIDWPMMDRHKRDLLPRLDRFVDLAVPERPHSLTGVELRATLRWLAAGPFRTLPTVSPGPWGGQWLRRRLGISTDGPNIAWSYELIAPESSVLLGEPDPVEVGFEILLAQAAPEVLGDHVLERFGGSFPIRFDYLDTLDGGHLSVHCHPLHDYMRDVFGWPYTQHESYYVMATQPGAFIFLGLADSIDIDCFRAEAETSQRDGSALDIERFVQTHPARLHALYLIPAGTPHASSEGNVVLEISATPYLYSLRFYDWLREDLDGTFRPVQLTHAFANLSTLRTGAAVRNELVPEPRPVRTTPHFTELELGRHPELFFVVSRLDFADHASDHTANRFHVLNLVDGDEIAVETDTGRSHPLAYGETILIPSSVGAYRLRRLRGGACKVVKAVVA